MVDRPYWQQRIEEGWQHRPVVWLRGVRRVGKTSLAQSLPDVEYFDCDLASVRHRVESTEAFLRAVDGRRVVLDEVHRLADPAEVLKVAADHFPNTRILATGSSTLQASTKFRDTLTGRKVEVWLVPLVSPDLAAFGRRDISRRCTAGGMPEPFLAGDLSEAYIQDWLQSYWARDVQELFRITHKWGFQRLCELLFGDSGAIFEASRYAGACELSRQTINNYVAMLEATGVAYLVRPFTTRRAAEIVRAPRVYMFDSGFARVQRGWSRPAAAEMGVLWEHVVLNEILGRVPFARVNYWRNKFGSEVDFVLAKPGRQPLAIECKWTFASGDKIPGLVAFRNVYPEGRNLVVTGEADTTFPSRKHGLDVTIVGLDGLIEQIADWDTA